MACETINYFSFRKNYQAKYTLSVMRARIKPRHELRAETTEADISAEAAEVIPGHRPARP